MTDIVERLRADAESTDDIGLCAEASDVIETLRSNLAEVAADWTKTQYELAAAQAREKVLRDALKVQPRNLRTVWKDGIDLDLPDRITERRDEALAMPVNDTALRAALANERFRIADWFYREGYLVKARDVPNAIRALGDE